MSLWEFFWNLISKYGEGLLISFVIGVLSVIFSIWVLYLICKKPLTLLLKKLNEELTKKIISEAVEPLKKSTSQLETKTEEINNSLRMYENNLEHQQHSLTLLVNEEIQKYENQLKEIEKRVTHNEKEIALLKGIDEHTIQQMDHMNDMLKEIYTFLIRKE